MNRTAENPQAAERRAKRFWVSLVVGLLGLQVVIGGVAITLATGDPSVAIVPDYHQAALNWDQHRAALSAPRRWGWQTQLDVSSTANTSGQRAIVLELRDGQGRPLSNLSVTARVFHQARASQAHHVALTETSEGRFIGSIEMARRGVWRLEVDVEGAAEPVRLSRTVTL
ncbi:FixH family protein [Roseimaritima sediminicola]|uniref:FixH family protein n=1 Tax=Roseimaritima sediminicola TaxID=2662066 RepID=UPI0012984689|nr:FixH family protein [Roseimaritima sediminicola]